MSTAIAINQLVGNSTDAEARQRAAFLFDNLLAAGWVRTADTGQTESNAMVHNGGANYQIWRMADALQATAPVFIKVEISPTGSPSSFTQYITIGTGSNGAGTITGVILGRTSMNVNSGAANAQRHFFSGSTNRCIVIWDFNNFNLGFFIERSKNADLTDNNAGLLVCIQQYNNPRFAFIPFAGTQPPQENSGNCLIPSYGTTGIGQNVGIYPPLYFNYDANVNSGLNFFGYRVDEIVTGAIIQATINGVNYTFYATGITLGIFANSRNNNAALLRYE